MYKALELLYSAARRSAFISAVHKAFGEFVFGRNLQERTSIAELLF
jgi:hypothetical protein